MLAVLAADWGLWMFRAVIAVLFGVIALALPDRTTVPVALLFGIYALLDGVGALIVAFHDKGLPGFGSLLTEGLVRFAASFVALAIAGGVSVSLPMLFAAWAGLSGIVQIATAAALRKEMTGEWPLPVAGTLSLLLAVVLVARPGIQVPAAVWLVASYLILSGFALMALAVRLRHLALEMAARA